MNKISFFNISILFLVVFVGCSPASKSSYLEKYDDFITEISENSQSYSDKDWEKMSEKHEKFSGKWYNKFEKEFTLKDQIRIKTNQAKWLYYYNLNDAASTIKQLFKSLDVNGMKKQAQYYIDNNMQNDLKKFYQDAKKAGKEAQEALTEILEELNVKINDLQK